MDSSDRKNIQNSGSTESGCRRYQWLATSSAALLDGPCQMLPNCLESPPLRAANVAAFGTSLPAECEGREAAFSAAALLAEGAACGGEYGGEYGGMTGGAYEGGG